MTVHHVGARPQLGFSRKNQARSRAVTCTTRMVMGRIGSCAPLRLFIPLPPITPPMSTFSPCLCGWVRGS